MKVLIVEDDHNTRAALGEIFRSEGFDPALARDGQEGLAFFHQGSFDLVCLDVMMPK